MARIRLVHNRTGETGKDKEFLVQIEVYHYDRIRQKATKKYISTDVRVKPANWKNGRVEGKKFAAEDNAKIKSRFEPIEELINKMGDRFTMAALDDLMKNKYRQSFPGFMEGNMEGLSTVKRRQHTTMIDHFRSYAGEVEFKDVDEDLIKGFRTHLMDEKNFMWSTAYGYLKYLRSHTITAIKKGFIQVDPFEDITMERPTYNKVKFLRSEEVAKIENLDLTEFQSLDKVRDVFIFACYTGLSFQDIRTFTKDQITEFDGEKVVRGERGKTGVEYRFILLPKAVEIMEKHNYELPLISHDKTNKYIKMVAQMAGVEKDITMHFGRHTCAMMLLNEGKMRFEAVAVWLGHASWEITHKTYAHLTDSTVVEEGREALKNISK